MAIELLTQQFVATVTSNRMYKDGGGLALRVQQDGRAKSWVYRYNGTPFGERAPEAITIGSAFKISLADARHKAAAYRALIDRNVSPRKYLESEKKARQAQGSTPADITWLEAVEEFYRHGMANLWTTKDTRDLMTTVRNKYLLPVFKDLPLRELKLTHVATILGAEAVNNRYHSGPPGSLWKARRSMARRIQSYIHGMINRAIVKGWHPGPNPAPFGKKDNDLITLLGKQPDGGHRRGLMVNEVPAFIAELRKPLHDDSVMTMYEATQATGRSAESIRLAIKKGLIPGAYYIDPKNPNQGYLIPIKQLAKVFPLIHEPEPLPDEQLYTWCLQYITFTVVRPSMGCLLKWSHIHEGERKIIYPREDHKMGHEHNRTYEIPITPAVEKLLLMMEARRDRERIKSDHVFMRAESRFGVGRWTDDPPAEGAINRNMKRVLERIDSIKTKNATPAGFRRTFGKWACDERDYDRVLANVALGHSIRGVMGHLGVSPDVDHSYFGDVKYKTRHRVMMEDWEKYCLSACGESGAIVPFRKKKEA
jgi:integrase